MALVAYSVSESESEHSDAEDNPEGLVTLIDVPENTNANGLKHQEIQLFNNLPQPRTDLENKEIVEEEDEFLLKKEVPVEKPVKIVLPSLSQFDSDDDDEPADKKQKTVKKGSGLFSVLPPPKSTPMSTTSFVPNVLNKKLRPAQVKNVKQKKVTAPIKASKPPNTEDTDDEDDVKMETFDDETWKQVCGRKKKVAQPVFAANAVEVPELPVIDAAPDAVEPYSGLDNAAFKKLVGSNKLKRGNIKLIDLDEEDVQGDKDLWMTKALTDPECKPKYVVENPVNDTCRKKHHITYLAQQAKANEQELQNQWSQSRHSRKQTQAKYGF